MLVKSGHLRILTDMGGKSFEWENVDAEFSNQMRAVCATPQDHIAIAVSGGADSMALCLLAARWMKSAALAGEKCGDLIAYVVDHNIRSCSADEAIRVKRWVRELGLRCKILKCEWLQGLPSQGHLQESARNARYSLLSLACEQTKAKALLTAHHSDDQAELFILRLSRCSGFAGLAGMASARHLYPTFLPSTLKCNAPSSLLLIRPLLQFSKDDLYSVCEKSGQSWIEDPTNENLSFARNRIRKALREPTFITMRAEILALVSFCRKLRSILDRDCDRLLQDVAWVSQEFGHVTLDVEKLFSSDASDVVIRRAIGAILQFVTQKSTPPRGRAVRALLERLSAKSLKGAYTVGGCNISPVPGWNNFRVTISFSPHSPFPSARGGVRFDHFEGARLPNAFTTSPISSASPVRPLNKIRDRLLGKGHMASTFVSTSLLEADSTAPSDTIRKFKSFGLISDNCESLLKDLASRLSEDMSMQPNKQPEQTLSETHPSTTREVFKQPIQFGEWEYFMDRFVVLLSSRDPEVTSLNATLWDGAPNSAREFCPFLTRKETAFIRHYEERDMQCLSWAASGLSDTRGSVNSISKRSNCQRRLELQSGTFVEHPCKKGARCAGSFLPVFKPILTDGSSTSETDIHTLNQRVELNACERNGCLAERASTAKEAYKRLKSLPRYVRRGLPVIVTAQGILLGVPIMGYTHCSLTSVTAKFRPISPLGGGSALWL